MAPPTPRRNEQPTTSQIRTVHVSFRHRRPGSCLCELTNALLCCLRECCTRLPTIQLARKNSFFLLFFCIHLWDGFALGEQRERGGVSVIKIISYTRCVRLMKRGRQQTAHINQLRHCFLLLPSGFSACFGRGWGYVRCMYGMECRNLGSNAKLFSFRLARVIGDLRCFWFNVGCDAFVAAGTCGVHVLLSTVHIYMYLLCQPTE
jgi:hypothetical protein